MSSRKARAARASVAPADRPKAPPSTDVPRRPRSRRYQRNEAIDATPSTVVSIFAHAAQTGDTSRQTQFYKDCRILDSRVDTVSATRTLAVQGRPLVFKPPPGFEADKEAKLIAERTTRLWNSTKRTVGGLGHLAHGTLEAHAGLAMRWGIDRLTGWHRPEFLIEHSHSSLFCWDPDTLEPWFNGTGGARPSKPDNNAFPLSERPDQFLFFAPLAGRADDPWRRGALRSCVIRSLVKRRVVGWWAAMVERYGQPQLVATVDGDMTQSTNDADSADFEDEINEALAAIGSDWAAQFPKGVSVEGLKVELSDALHPNFVNWANVEDAIAVLGQNLSTEAQGGSYAAATAHNRIRIDILTSDCMELAEAITDQWAEPIVRYNWPGAPVPYAEFIIAPRRELTVADFVAGLVPRGQVLVSMGHEPGDRADEYIGEGRAINPGTPPAASNAEPSKPSDTKEPGPSKPEGGEPRGVATPAKADDAPDAEPAETDATTIETEGGAVVEKLADAALNGAQMGAMEVVITKVEDGFRAPATAIEQISSQFASIPRAKIESLINTITPRTPGETSAAAPPPVPVPADDA